ncbi:MAG: DNA repair protein RecO [Coriobacteriales bacterium]|jgi:DNA repair protein RecO (recombination protein O)|nr:DNA repair protein RecO [Coriobacteriales bacterium]
MLLYLDFINKVAPGDWLQLAATPKDAMPTYSTQALVLKKTKLGETDLIITLFSAEGRQVKAVAKGARKPGSRLGAHLELYSVVDLLLHTGKSLDIVTEVRTVTSNNACRKDVEHSAGAAVIVELLEKASRDGTVEERLFPLSVEALRCVGEVGEEGIPLIVGAAILKVVAQLGFRPALRECAVCGTPRNGDARAGADFSCSQGGVLCEECCSGEAHAVSEPIDAATLTWLQACLSTRFADLACYCGADYARIGARLLLLSQEWMQTHLLIGLKSLDFLQGFIAPGKG